jgi:hypothetical protein
MGQCRHGRFSSASLHQDDPWHVWLRRIIVAAAAGLGFGSQDMSALALWFWLSGASNTMGILTATAP